MTRYLQIDFWRGMALLMIFINHMPGNPLTFVTLKRLGFCDAAEVFVFLAGVMTAIVIGRRYAAGFKIGIAATFKRIWILFRAHLMLVFGLSVVIAMAGLFTDSTPIKQEFNFSPFFLETDQAIVRLIRFAYMPNMTDILPLYIVLLLPVPLLFWLRRISPWLVLALSLAVWLAAPALMPVDTEYPDNFVWHFNPFAWQLIFVLGLLSQDYREKLLTLCQHRTVFVTAIAIVLFAFIAAAPWVISWEHENWRIISASVLVYDDKTNLSLLRLVHFMAVAVLAARVWPWLERHLAGTVQRKIIRLGQHSLLVFCCGSVLGMVLYIAKSLLGFNMVWYAALSLLGIGMLIGLAYMADIMRRLNAYKVTQ